MYCGLQLGAVTDEMFEKMAKHMETETTAPNTGKASTAQDEVKKARAITNNNLAIACLYYSDYENRQKQSMIGAIGGSVYKWHCLQNKQLRSAEKTYEFEMQMLSGQWKDHIIDIWAQLLNYDTMKSCGLTRVLSKEFLKPSVNGGEVCFLQEQSNTYCTFVTALVTCRIKCFLF